MTIEILRRDGFTVRWADEPAYPKEFAGIVAVASVKQARKLKANLETGMAPARAIADAIHPPRRKRGRPTHFNKLGGLARSQQLSAEQLSAIGKIAAAARWGKRKKVAK